MKNVNSEELLLSKKQLEIILKNMADAVIAQDVTGKLIFANNAAAKLLGYNGVAEMLAAPSMEYLKKYEFRDEHGQLFDSAKMPGRRAIFGEKEAQVLLQVTNRKTGQVAWVNIISTAIFNKDNKPTMVINTMQDLTDRKLAEQEKSDFLSMTSHELKTPLTSLTLFLALLRSKFSNPEKKQKYYLNRINEQVQKLIELTNDLLDVSRIETGKLRLKKEKFSLDELIMKSIEEIQPTTTKHTIRIHFETKEYVFGDVYRISQVVVNLLMNAIKYSPAGGEIDVIIERNNGEVVVKVRDKGLGIKKSQQEKIFSRLYQGDDPKSRTYPGLGLGLYISKEIIERNKGRIWVKSEEGKGSTFYFALPVFK